MKRKRNDGLEFVYRCRYAYKFGFYRHFGFYAKTDREEMVEWQIARESCRHRRHYVILKLFIYVEQANGRFAQSALGIAFEMWCCAPADGYILISISIETKWISI